MNLTDLTICYKCHSLFKMFLILFIYLVGLFFGTQNIPLIFQSSFLGFLIFIYYIKLIFSQYFYFYRHWILRSFSTGLITLDVMQYGKEEILSKDVRFYHMICSIFS